MSLFKRISESLSSPPVTRKAVCWRGYLAALDEWTGGVGKAFELLPQIQLSPTIDSFGFAFDVDVREADVAIPPSVLNRIENQPDTLAGDLEADDSCWVSRIDSIAGEKKEALNHGEIRKLLQRRLHTLKTAFGKDMPDWIIDWWRGAIYALHENRILTTKDTEVFDNDLPGWKGVVEQLLTNKNS